jgi:hypothetical protein
MEQYFQPPSTPSWRAQVYKYRGETTSFQETSYERCDSQGHCNTTLRQYQHNSHDSTDMKDKSRLK